MITGCPGASREESVTGTATAPRMFVAVMVAVNSPDAVGVPRRFPVAASTVTPAGRRPSDSCNRINLSINNDGCLLDVDIKCHGLVLVVPIGHKRNSECVFTELSWCPTNDTGRRVEGEPLWQCPRRDCKNGRWEGGERQPIRKGRIAKRAGRNGVVNRCGCLPDDDGVRGRRTTNNGGTLPEREYVALR